MSIGRKVSWPKNISLQRCSVTPDQENQTFQTTNQVLFTIFCHFSMIYEIRKDITKFEEMFGYFNGLLQCFDQLIITTIFLIDLSTPFLPHTHHHLFADC